MKDGTYTIGEFAQFLGVSKAAIYRWEKEGRLPEAKRQKRGQTDYRYYTTDDIHEARNILRLPPLIENPRKQLFLNFKGGTGKSVISANYGYRIAQYGVRVLMVDLDPQGHLTKCLSYNSGDFRKTLFDVIINKEPLQSAIISTSLSTMDLVPASLELSPIELALTPLHAREYKLRRALDSVKNLYDLMILDAPPNIGLLNLNAILAVDDLFIPVLADFLSYDGLKILFETLTSIEDDFSYSLENIYILLNKFNPSHKICLRSQEALKQHYSQYLLETVIRQNTTLSDATAQQKSIFAYAPSSRAAVDIDKLVNKVFFSHE